MTPMNKKEPMDHSFESAQQSAPILDGDRTDQIAAFTHGIDPQAEAPKGVTVEVARLMRWIDGYAFDYAAEGKLGTSRQLVEKELAAALATQPPALSQAEGVPAAWQMRTFYEDGGFDDPRWGAWYQCTAPTDEQLQREKNLGIRREYRALFAHPKAEPARLRSALKAIVATTNDSLALNTARNVLSQGVAGAEGVQCGWIDEFGNVFPMGAWKPSQRTYHDDHKAKWEPIYRAHPGAGHKESGNG